jgi:anti-sigma B factor antagonist
VYPRKVVDITEGESMVNLYIGERRERDITILDLKGRIRISGGTLMLHKAIRCLLDEGKTKILLNLASVTHIDSMGLGELISSHITLANKGAELKLVNLTERVQEVMRITKLLTVFDIYENEPDALASFTGHVLSVVEPQVHLM